MKRIDVLNLAHPFAGMTLPRFDVHQATTYTRLMTFPRKPDSFELEVGRFFGFA
jgi:hypothetical protein